MNHRLIRLLTGVTALLILQGCTLFGIRNYELLSYEVVLEDSEFQVRQYNDYVAATVTTQVPIKSIRVKPTTCCSTTSRARTRPIRRSR
jgi:hypothetical protein